MPPVTLALTGIDGAGKSTLLQSVKDTLQERGYSVECVYGRFTPHLSKPLILLGEQIFIDGDYQEQYESHTEQKKEFFSSVLTRISYEGMVASDYFLYIWYQYLTNYSKDVIIFDRYVMDTILKGYYDKLVSDHTEALEKYGRYIQYFPKLDYTFYISVSVKTAMERKDDIPAKSYIVSQKNNYDQFFSEFESARTLDGEQSVDELTKVVMEIIEV